MTRFLVPWLLFASRFVLSAQTPAYLHYVVSDGLPSNMVYCGTQDHEGLLWFGTDKGLASFDGTRFRTFSIKDGLPDPEVLNVWEDSRERLWICCFQKKPCYRRNARIFLMEDPVFQVKTGLTPLYTFFEDKKNDRIWIGTGSDINGIVISGKQSMRISSPVAVLDFNKLGDRIIGLCQKDIVGRVNDSIFESIFSFSPKYFNVDNYRVDGDGVIGNRILYAHYGHLYLFEWDGKNFKLIEQRKESTGSIYVDRKNRFWVCSGVDGVVCFDNTEHNLSRPKRYLPGKKVSSMFEDSQGTRWFCTKDDGIYGLPRSAAVTYTTSDGLRSNNITALQAGSDGALLAGDDNAGLYQVRGGVITHYDLDRINTYNKTRQIAVNDKREIIVATDKEIYIKSGNKVKETHHTFGAPKSILVKKDTLWIGSHANFGFAREDLIGKRFVLSSRRVTRIAEDSDGYIWFGSVDGLYSQQNGFQTNWSEAYPELRGRIVDIQKANQGGLWIVTPEYGLMLARTSEGKIVRLEVVNKHLKSPIENIQCVFVASDGLLWLGTNNGVHCLYPDWSEAHFDRHDGLANDDVNTILVKGDTLWVGTVSGLTCLTLKSSANTKKYFPTYITSVSYQEKDASKHFNLMDSVDVPKRLWLSPGASVVKVNMTGIDYRSRGNLRYHCVITKNLLPWYYWTTDNLFGWIINGFKSKSDTSWVTGGELNFGVYLPPAAYDIRVTAATHGGVFSESPDQWTLVKLPYWYATVWVGLFAWVIAVAAIWWFWRTRSLNRHLHMQVSELQLQALQAQMNPHFIGNSINTIQQFFYSPDPVKASEYTSVFIRLLRSTMLFSEWHFISFSEELNYLRDYLNMVKLRYGDFFHYEISGAESIPPDTPFPAMLLQPIVENAVIHGMASEQQSVLTVTISAAGPEIICVVEDNGIGYNQMLGRKKIVGNERKSKGLELLQKKMQALNSIYKLGAVIEIEDLSEKDRNAHGTRVTVRFLSLRDVRAKLKKLYTR